MRRALIGLAMLAFLPTASAQFAQCGDGVDNDGDGLVDLADLGCGSSADNTEDSTVCSDDCFCTANADTTGGTTSATDPSPTDPTFTDCADFGDRTLCPLDRQACTASSTLVYDPATGTRQMVSGYQCPSGAEHACIVDPADGNAYCSPHTCVAKTTPPTQTTDTGTSFPSGDGPRDANGQCLGPLQVFAGAAKRCHRAGTQTAFQNCCDNDYPKLTDTVGAQGEPNQVDYRKQHSSFEVWANQCDVQDQETALLADSEYCISLGTYCAEKWPLVGCVQRNESYCCFNSKLAKLIQEQGRAQLPSMGDFGPADAPICRGFTMEEFQALDFSKIDLSAYSNDLRTRAPALIQQGAQDAVRRRLVP